MALLSGNFSKYEFLTGEDVLPEKGLLRKTATIRRCEYGSLCNDLKKQTSIQKLMQAFQKSNKGN